MAVSFPTSALVGLLGASFDLDTDDIRAVLLLNTYSFNSAHDFLDDISAGHRAAILSSAIAGASITGGVFDANDITFPAVVGPGTANALYLYEHNASENAARLLGYCPLSASVTLNGSNIDVTWDNGANKIFKLAGG